MPRLPDRTTTRARALTNQAATRLRLTGRGLLALGVAVLVALATFVGLLGIGEDVTQSNGLATADPGRLRFFVDHRTSALIAAARDVTNAGAVPVLAGLSVVIAALLWWRGQRLIVAVAPGAAFVAAGVLVAVTKQAVGRARPDAAIRLATETEASFPSGHSADGTALYVTLALVLAVLVLRRPLARFLAVAAAIGLSGAIGLSRLTLAVHWPTDVMAGWALGLVVALVVTTAAVLIDRAEPTGAAAPEGRGGALRRGALALLRARRAGPVTTPAGAAAAA